MPRQKKVLSVALISDIHSLDPRKGFDCPTSFVVKMLFEGLMYVDPDGHIKPALAHSYTISDDQMKYTFYLRPAVWSNGNPITAYDFEYSWKQMIDPKTKCSGVYVYYPIKNVADIVSGKKSLDEAGVHALDDKTLIVELEYPTPFFLELTALSVYAPVHAALDQKDPAWSEKEGKDFICSGPFTLAHHQAHQEIYFQRNPSYWNAENVHLPGILWQIIPDEMAQWQLFEKGELDWIGKPFSKLPLEVMRKLKEEEKIECIPAPSVVWYLFNTQTYPFNHKKMRQAFCYAINRKALCEYVTQDGEQPLLTVLPYSLALQDNPYFQDNNKKRAQELLKEALSEMGYTRETLPVIKLSHSSSTLWAGLAKTIQKQWYETLGIWVELVQEDWGNHYNKLLKGDYQIGGIAWVSDVKDPIYFLKVFRFSYDRINMTKWEHPMYQYHLTKADWELNPIERNLHLHRAEQILMEELPIAPIISLTMSYGKSKKLKNVGLSELNHIDFRFAYFEH